MNNTVGELNECIQERDQGMPMGRACRASNLQNDGSNDKIKARGAMVPVEAEKACLRGCNTVLNKMKRQGTMSGIIYDCCASSQGQEFIILSIVNTEASQNYNELFGMGLANLIWKPTAQNRITQSDTRQSSLLNCTSSDLTGI